MSLKVKSLVGRTMYINIIEGMKVEDIKLEIQYHEGIDFTQIRLISEGKLLNDEMKVDESFAGKTIHMVLSLRGG